jgi:nicotinate phosphoribosyltransferase
VACKKYSINNKLSKEEFSNLFVLAMSGDEDILQKINTPYYQEAMKRLDDKILILKNHPEIKFFDFSTRRRFSQELQENILLKLSSEFHRPQFIGISQFLGTSNEYIGFKHSMKVGGTYAHEMPQVITALSEPDETNMLNAQYEFMRKWNKFYGYDLSVGLTDTFGSDSFFKNCPEDIANMYSFREDSSTNIYKYTNDVLDLYKKFNINHNEKVIVHSNGLDIGKVLDINSFSQNKINKVYGIGTNIGADVGNNYKNISIVIKATKVNGIDTVKLSDNIAKAIGKKEKIKLYKKVFGYQISTFVEQIY